MACFEHGPDASLEIDLDGVELKNVITPQDFLPGGSSDWAPSLRRA